jgi:hypothetical protein
MIYWEYIVKIHYFWNGSGGKNFVWLMSGHFTRKFLNEAYLRQVCSTPADTGAKYAKRVTIVISQIVICCFFL